MGAFTRFSCLVSFVINDYALRFGIKAFSRVNLIIKNCDSIVLSFSFAV